MSEFLIVKQSLIFFPIISSVANDDAAIAEPHPKVLNLASTIFPFYQLLFEVS